ncbi:hypothetical protein [Streptomyces anandii]|uniref:hypothetical protein n=1 Tax=Streptomyces anandii TaxID=285454 RepID=UPI0037BBCAD6
MSTGVHRYLVTAALEPRLRVWQATAAFANWLEGRLNSIGGETWLVTVLAEHSDRFLQAGRDAEVTVEEIDNSGPTETYQLRVGQPGTGWQPTPPPEENQRG